MRATREIEVRYVTTTVGRIVLDEIVATNAAIHLEQMSKNEFCLIIESRHERALFYIGARQAAVTVFESAHDVIAAGRQHGHRKRGARL